MINKGFSLSRRNFLKACGGMFLTGGLGGKERIYSVDAYASLVEDIPAYRQEDDNRVLVEGPSYPKGCLLRIDRIIAGTEAFLGLPMNWWLGIERDSWLHNPKAPLAQKDLVVPLDLRRINLVTRKDMAPINSLRENHQEYVPPESKRIEVDLESQSLTAFEEEEIVLRASISSGLWDTTPRGEFSIGAKTPSRYMQGSDFDLPGVPYNNFFTERGHAIHGTYWHYRFGTTPQSHGCINAPTSAAEKIFRWSQPVMNHEVERTYGAGTKLIIW